MTVLRLWLRRGAGRLRAAGTVGLMWCRRWTRIRSGVVLMYHRVEPRQGDPRTEFTPPLHRSLFAWQLRHLARHYRVVPAEAIQEAVCERRRGQRFPVALTFDDDTVSHVAHAAPLLRQQRLPATFFLNGQALEHPRAYWWERLQTAYARCGSWRTLVPPNVLAAATAAAGGCDPEAYEITIAVQHMSPSARGAWAETLLERVGEDPPDAGLRVAQVSDLHRAGFAIGFHGANHEPLSLLAPDELETELTERREPLEALIGEPLRLISYPHGQVNGTVVEAARAHGFEHGFTVEEIAVTPRSDSMLLGRLDAQIEGRARFARRLAHMLCHANEARWAQ